MSQHGFINVNFYEKLTKFPDYTLEVTSRFIKGTLKEHSSFPELTCPTPCYTIQKETKNLKEHRGGERKIQKTTPNPQRTSPSLPVYL